MRKYIALLACLWTSVASANVPCAVPNNLTNGTLADANQVMANYNAILTCLTLAAKAGANSDITSLTALSTPIAPTAGGSSVFVGGTSSGTANAQVITTPSPTGFTLTRGYSIIFTAGLTNTAALQINVNGTGLTNTYLATQNGPLALIGGEVTANNLVWAVYDGTEFQLIGTNLQLGGSGPSTTIASATTTDLGTVASHYATITGTTTITSFGSTATTAYPVYRVAFAGALTLTYNGTSMILPGGVNILTAAGDTADLVYGGSGNWAVIRYNAAQASPVYGQNCGANGLVITNNAAQQVTVTYKSAVMTNSAGYGYYTTTTPSVINFASANGAGALDAGTQAANWYYIYLIYNGTTVAGIGSLSSTAPTISGYPFQCRLGAVRASGAATMLNSKQTGNRAQYIAAAATTLPSIISGTANVTFWTAESVTTVVPATATRISVNFYFSASAGANSNNSVGLAPNANYGTGGSVPQAPLYFSFNPFNQTTNFQNGYNADLELESTSVYFGSASSASLNTYAVTALGWTDAVNAN